MAGPHQPNSDTWAAGVAQLKAQRCSFRIYRRSHSTVIYVRQYLRGKPVATFSTKSLRHSLPDGGTDSSLALQIQQAVSLCQRAHALGGWVPQGPAAAEHTLAWKPFIASFLAAYQANVIRGASKADNAYLALELAQLPGLMSLSALAEWFQQTDPFQKPARFKKMLQLARDLQRYTALDTTAIVAAQSKRRPTKAQRESRGLTHTQPRAIPTDQQLFHWLLAIEQPLTQWLLALIAVYGLRPSEAWHAEGIDPDGLLLRLPGRPRCKTYRRYVRPCPAEWVEAFGLARNFDAMQAELHSSYSIQWDETGRVPLNNSRVAHSGCYQPITKGRIPKLWAQRFDDGPQTTATDWCRPYDLRHAYAIRLFSHPETTGYPIERHAWWMGHSLQQHKDVYLKWMPLERQREADGSVCGSHQASVETRLQGLEDKVERSIALLDRLLSAAER